MHDTLDLLDQIHQQKAHQGQSNDQCYHALRECQLWLPHVRLAIGIASFIGLEYFVEDGVV